MHGKIFPIRKLVLPLHLYCRCVVVPMQAIASGYATQEGVAGADYWLNTTSVCLKTTSPRKTLLILGGYREKETLTKFSLEKLLEEVYTLIVMGTFLLLLDAYGTKQISITPAVSEVQIEYCIPMMA